MTVVNVQSRGMKRRYKFYLWLPRIFVMTIVVFFGWIIFSVKSSMLSNIIIVENIVVEALEPDVYEGPVEEDDSSSVILGGEVVTDCPLTKDVSWATPERQAKWAAIRDYCSLIIKASEKYSLDVHLLGALIWWESGGDPLAYSGSGAVGLMQVMPRDGIAASYQCINGPCFTNRPSIEELEDPAFNIDYGSRLLAGLIDREGSMREGLYRYGPYDIGYSYADKILELYRSIK